MTDQNQFLNSLKLVYSMAEEQTKAQNQTKTEACVLKLEEMLEKAKQGRFTDVLLIGLETESQGTFFSYTDFEKDLIRAIGSVQVILQLLSNRILTTATQVASQKK